MLTLFIEMQSFFIDLFSANIVIINIFYGKLAKMFAKVTLFSLFVRIFGYEKTTLQFGRAFIISRFSFNNLIIYLDFLFE